MDTSNTFNKFFTPIISINRNHNTLPSKDDLTPKYNWVDARLLAEKIFRNYSFELPWAEDMWNILMFNDIVISKNMIGSKLDDYDKGDIILWLLAMDRLYFDFKVRLTLAFETGRESLLERTWHIDNADEYKAETLHNDIINRLKYATHDIDIDKDDHCEINLLDVDPDEYKYEFEDALFEEVKRRKEVVIKSIYSYFENDFLKITEFMQGIHWYENYLNINDFIGKEEERIRDKFENYFLIINEGKVINYKDGEIDCLFEDEHDVEYQMEIELGRLIDLYRKNVYDENSNWIYSWVSGGMCS